MLAEYFGWKSISVGDLLKKEVSKKSEFGKAISDALKNYRYGMPYPNHKPFQSMTTL